MLPWGSGVRVTHVQHCYVIKAGLESFFCLEQNCLTLPLLINMLVTKNRMGLWETNVLNVKYKSLIHKSYKELSDGD
jgi:hypothetical protein